MGGGGGEGEGGFGGEAMFTTFGALAALGASGPSLTVTSGGGSTDVFVATDMRFEVKGASIPCVALVPAATLRIPTAYVGKLTVYDASGGAPLGIAQSDGYTDYTTGPDPDTGKFWWEADATEVCMWKEVKAVVAYQDPKTGAISLPETRDQQRQRQQ